MNVVARTAVFAAFATISAGSVQAGTIFTSEVSFLAALDSYYTETYASLPVGSAPLNYSGNGFSYELKSAARINSPGAIVPAGSSYAIDPNAMLGYLNDLVFRDFSGGGFDAIGGYFYNSSFSGGLYSDNIRLIFSDGTDTEFFQYGAESFPKYFGYLASPGTKLTFFGVLSPHLNPTIDRLTVGNRAAGSVPEPSIAALMASALLALGLVRWFRRRPAVALRGSSRPARLAFAP